MRKLAGLAITVLLFVAAPAYAQVCTESGAPVAKPACRPCGCQKAAVNPLILVPPEPAEAEEVPLSPVEAAMRRDLLSTVALGAILFTAGQAIAIAHYTLGDGGGRAYDFVPVIGPGVVAVHYRTPDWTSPLVFSSWLQAAGVIIAASAGYALSQTRVQVSASVGTDSGSLEIGGRF